jgi:hypothetical protein
MSMPKSKRRRVAVQKRRREQQPLSRATTGVFNEDPVQEPMILSSGWSSFHWSDPAAKDQSAAFQPRPARALHQELPTDPLNVTFRMLLEGWDDLLDAEDQPECDGPVLIHADGTFECHGSCGPTDEDVVATWHPGYEEDVWICADPEPPPHGPLRKSCDWCGAT